MLITAYKTEVSRGTAHPVECVFGVQGGKTNPFLEKGTDVSGEAIPQALVFVKSEGFRTNLLLQAVCEETGLIFPLMTNDEG